MYIKGSSKLNQILKYPLNIVSLPYKLISLLCLKIKSLNQKKFTEVFIISVDNLSFGGTGKTSLVIEIGKTLQKRDIRFAIVTRGYKSKFEKRGLKIQSKHSVEEIGDEARIFKDRFPDQDIFIGKNRRKSIEEAISNKNQIVILDDGFQSTHIYRDFKIILFNPSHPYYYLRNFKFLMKVEDIILFYLREGKKAAFSESGIYSFEIENFYNKNGNCVDIKGSSIMGFSAVGDNLRFKSDLEKFNLILFKGYKDHHTYTEEEIKSLNNLRIQNGADYLVCTEKDFVKLRNFKLNDVPLIFSKNIIKFDINLTGYILNDAEKKGFIKT